MKKLVILKHGGGELANQLWNYASIYAYGLESGAKVSNPSFFEYHRHFRFIEDEGALTKIFSLWFKDNIGRRGNRRNRFWRTMYAAYSKLIASLHGNSLVSSVNSENKPVYLPPTAGISFPNRDTLYFLGWLFRNADGLKKYRKELIQAFSPAEHIAIKCNETIKSLKLHSERVIGIHIRQGDYKFFKDGRFLISEDRARKIVDEYISINGVDIDRTVFIITSDGPIDEKIWSGLNVKISKENSVTDLFLLSKTDVVIGSDSSFGAFAAWYGNIPHVIFKNEQMDWQYYKDKAGFSPNKYAMLVI